MIRLQRIILFILIILSSIVGAIILILKMGWSFAVDWEKRIDDFITIDNRRLDEEKYAKEKQRTR